VQFPAKLSSVFAGLSEAACFPTLVGDGFVHIFGWVLIRTRQPIAGGLHSTRMPLLVQPAHF